MSSGGATLSGSGLTQGVRVVRFLRSALAAAIKRVVRPLPSHWESRNIRHPPGLMFLTNKEETTMKLSTLALAGALAMSSTFALAQAGGANGAGAAAIPENSGTATNAQGGAVGAVRPNDMRGGTTGMGTAGTHGSNVGTAGGPTSLSGTGSSMDGGQKPADTGKH
jgi:hypothetical protein